MLDAKLVVVGGHANKGEVKLKLPMTIGRNPGLGLTINHNMVSRLHCQIYERDGALVVRDNNSSNGTFINNERIDEAVLKPGDRLQCGPLTFVAIYQHSGDFPVLSRPASKPKGEAPKPEPPKSDTRATQMFTGLEALGAEEEEESPFAAFEQDLSGGALGLADLVADSEGSLSQIDEMAAAAPTPSVPSRPEPEFAILVQMEHAGTVQVGTPVRAAGVAAGSVVFLERVEVNGQPLVQAMLSLPRSLGAVLRDDMKISIGQAADGTPVFEISSPGSAGQNVSNKHIVRLHGGADAFANTEMQLGNLMDDVPEEDELGVLGTSPSLAEDDGLGIFDSPPSRDQSAGGIFDTDEDDDDLGVLGGARRSEEAKPADITSFFSALTDGMDDDEDSSEIKESEQTMDQDALSLFRSGLADESSDAGPIRLDEIDDGDAAPSSDLPEPENHADNGAEDLFKDYKFDDLAEDEYHR